MVACARAGWQGGFARSAAAPSHPRGFAARRPVFAREARIGASAAAPPGDEAEGVPAAQAP